jgi:hypothetical protein
LRELEDPHIVRLVDVFPHKRNLSLVIVAHPDTLCISRIS